MAAATSKTTETSGTITCARPGCGTQTTLAESTYVDGCGQICPRCDEAMFGPRPAWYGQINPPY
jgi:hypothetical protein